MSVCLDVVFISQLNYGPGLNDYTGCWYCSAEMIGKTFEAGPRMGVPEIHSASGHAATGSDEAYDRRFQHYLQSSLKVRGKQLKKFSNTENEHQLLAKRENLRPVENHVGDWTLAELEHLLRSSGPIFFYWMKTPKGGGGDYGHASVLVGTDDKGHVLYHDPESGPYQTMRLDSFNGLKQEFKYGMMRRRGATGAGLTRSAPSGEEHDLDLGSLFG